MDYKENYETDYCKEKVEGFFSELKENKDEKMRRPLLRYVKSGQDGYCSWNSDKDFCNDAIAWLEKQGEKANPYSGVSFEYNGDVWGMCARDNGVEIMLNGELVKYLEPQGEQGKQHLYDVIVALWDLLDKIDTFSDLHIHDMDSDNPFRKIEHITQERHKFVKSDGYDLFIGNCNITNHKKFVLEEDDEMVEDDEVNPSPKFKVGDWVVQGCNVLKIRCLYDEYYAIESVGGYIGYMLISEIDSLYHLWTVKDAKDTDVLVCDSKYGQQIGLVKEYVGKIRSADTCFDTYCCVDCDGNFRVCEYMGSPNIHPSTIDQSDLFFKRINDEGYVWNEEKKELKKVEQKPTDNAEPKFKVGD